MAVAPLTIYDSCARTSTTTPGSTDTGHTWVPRKGTWGTTGTRLYSVTAADDDQVTLELGSTEQQAAARPYGIGTNRYPELLVRWSATGTHYWAEASPAGAVVILRRLNDGFTTLATSSSGAITDGALLALRAVEVSGGTKLTAYVNGAQVATTTDTAGSRPMGMSIGLRHGATSGGQSIQWDDIHATTLDSPFIAQKAAGWAVQGSTSLTLTLPVAPAVGSRLFALFAIDKSAGTVTTPSGWTSFLPTSALSVTLVSLTRPASGVAADREVTLPWTTAQGAQALIVEIPAAYAGALQTINGGTNSSDAALTSVTTESVSTVDKAALTLSYLAVDSGASAFTTSGDPQWSTGQARVHSNPGSIAGTAINGGVSLDMVSRAVVAGDDPGATASWGTADQAVIRTLIIYPPVAATTSGLRVRKSGAWVDAKVRRSGAWTTGPKIRKNGAWS